jgi:hypothetical protein
MPARTQQSRKVPGPKQAPERPVKYPRLDVKVFQLKDAITAKKMADLLGWETEPQYIARRKKEDPSLKEGELGFGKDFLLKNLAGEKVRCWNNLRNRPFDEGHARRLAQVVLNRQWAGPLTMPGQTVNGEPMIISRRALVISGQHRGAGLILADEIWRGPQHDHWVERGWKTPPVLETIVNFGVSEDPAVVMTIDNVKPRSLGDVFYTSDLFSGLAPKQREECAKMLAVALKLLWKRGAANASRSDFEKYMTHATSVEYQERHKRMLEAVRHLFNLNTVEGRAISDPLGLSPGRAACLLYLMATCRSDVDEYINMERPSEEKLDFSEWDRAVRFWTLLAQNDKEVKAVRDALGHAVDATARSGGKWEAQSAVLCKAWPHFLENHRITADDLKLHFDDDSNGKKFLAERPTCGGIDLGEGVEDGSGDEPDEEERERVERRKQQTQELLRRREEKQRKEAEAGGGGAVPANREPAPADSQPPTAEELAARKQEHGGAVLLFHGPGHYVAWGSDALTCAKTLGRKMQKTPDGHERVTFLPTSLADTVAALTGRGLKVAVVEPGTNSSRNGVAPAQPKRVAGRGDRPMTSRGPR